jgi:hypothetical protein
LIGAIGAKGEIDVEFVHLFVSSHQNAGDRLQRLHEVAGVERNADPFRPKNVEELPLTTDMPTAVTRTVR